jgi:hypothetical protein
MSTASNASGILPNNQPFNNAPYNYNGTESVSNFATDIVDWVLVELRDPMNESTVIETKAALVKANGELVDPNGGTSLVFSTAPSGEYFLVLRQKSHVAIMSANPVSLPGAMVDFTTSSTAVKGTNQTKLVNGAFTMLAGDYSGNDTVNFQDFILWLSSNSILNTYLFVDADGNGTINFTDFILWLGNNNHLAYSGI